MDEGAGREVDMVHEFCPDCGHLLSKTATPCAYCGWSERIDYLAYRRDYPDDEGDIIYGLADDVFTEVGLRL